MNTRKSISTIHYVEPDLLKVRLDDLIQKNKITFYAFIQHLKEEDETKDHIHLYIMPNGSINTDQLRNELEFINMTDITKPFRCLPFTTSKFPDWYQYVLHDRGYLLSKMQARKYSYQKNEIITSDPDYLNELVHTIDFSRIRPQQIIIEAANNKVPFDEIAATGVIPVQQFVQYQKLYETIFNRAVRIAKTHDNIDHETGELIETDEPW